MTTQDGSVSVVVAVMVALAMVGAVLVSDLAKVALVRTSLVTAADAAALAAAPATFASFGKPADPHQAAAELAAANGAELVACVCPVDRSWRSRRVVVTVSADLELVLLPDRSLTASAAAEFRPVALGMVGRDIYSESPPSQ